MKEIWDYYDRLKAHKKKLLDIIPEAFPDGSTVIVFNYPHKVVGYRGSSIKLIRSNGISYYWPALSKSLQAPNPAPLDAHKAKLKLIEAELLPLTKIRYPIGYKFKLYGKEREVKDYTRKGSVIYTNGHYCNQINPRALLKSNV